MRTLWNMNAPEQARLTLTDAPIIQSLTEKYRPRALSEVIGQAPIVAALRAFLRAPYSAAFLFSGPTGTGKSSTAHALTGELRVDRGVNWEHIMSGSQDADCVQRIIDGWRVPPWGINAWRFVLVDEADQATSKARQLWLTALETLPARTVIVFTTNHPEKFEQRTLDRFNGGHFAFRADDLAAAQSHADALWQAETGSDDGLPLERLPNVVIDGEVSIRRVVQAVQAAVRDGAILPTKTAPTARRVALPNASYRGAAAFDVHRPKAAV
jgi:hypothetical protein